MRMKDAYHTCITTAGRTSAIVTSVSRLGSMLLLFLLGLLLVLIVLALLARVRVGLLLGLLGLLELLLGQDLGRAILCELDVSALELSLELGHRDAGRLGVLLVVSF